MPRSSTKYLTSRPTSSASSPSSSFAFFLFLSKSSLAFCASSRMPSRPKKKLLHVKKRPKKQSAWTKMDQRMIRMNALQHLGNKWNVILISLSRVGKILTLSEICQNFNQLIVEQVKRRYKTLKRRQKQQKLSQRKKFLLWCKQTQE